DHVGTALPFTGQLEPTLVEDRRPRRGLALTERKRLRRAELTSANDVHLRDRGVRLAQLVQRLGLDQIHLGETEEREVVRLRAAARNARLRGELVVARPLGLRRLRLVRDVDREDERVAGTVVHIQAGVEALLLPDEEDVAPRVGRIERVVRLGDRREAVPRSTLHVELGVVQRAVREVHAEIRLRIGVRDEEDVLL